MLPELHVADQTPTWVMLTPNRYATGSTWALACSVIPWPENKSLSGPPWQALSAIISLECEDGQMLAC